MKYFLRTIKRITIILLFCCFLISFPTVNAKESKIPHLRGVMTGIDLQKKDIIELANDWNVNHIRWQLLWEPKGDDQDLQQYSNWLDSALIRLDQILIFAEQVGIKVVVDLHSLPGGRTDNEQSRLFTESKYQQYFIKIWQKIARRYKNNTTVWAYDLANEPVQGKVASGLLSWHQLATTVSKKIREIDNYHAIIFEPSPWANPEGFKHLKPINVSGMVYSFHMYLPHAFTHQGISGFGPWGISYPGKIDEEYWNKAQLIENLKPVIDFQKKYSAIIYVGEFSALRWSPGESAFLYLKDCIEIFESFGWHWVYHAFREWDGWSVEHSQNKRNKNTTIMPTARQKLLQHWYKLN